MKTFFLGSAFLASICFSLSAHSDEMKCHALKFDSYFVAQNVKDNLKSINSNVDHPNFDQKYLLLRADLAMETLWLIASCETGEFYHEKQSGDHASFSVDGPGIDISDKTESRHYEWNGNSWLKGETKSAQAQTPAPTTPATPTTSASTSAGGTLLSGYQTLFAKYPPKETMSTCAPVDYSSNFIAQKNKEYIQKNTADFNHPNFAGSKLLLSTEAIFETVTLIADCKTGKVSDEVLKDHIEYHADSYLVVANSSDTHPELKIWSENQWIQIPDPVQNKKITISNTLYGERALTLVNSLPNPGKRDVLRFENLKATPSTQPIFVALGVDSITSGKCTIPHGQSPVCEVDTQ